MIGRTIGQYRIVGKLGEGGMGVVYLAEQKKPKRQVALKVLPAGLAADDRAFQRFMREARAAGKLTHPNVVAVHANRRTGAAELGACDRAR